MLNKVRLFVLGEQNHRQLGVPVQFGSGLPGSDTEKNPNYNLPLFGTPGFYDYRCKTSVQIGYIQRTAVEVSDYVT